MGSGGTLGDGVRRWFQRRTNHYKYTNLTAGSGDNPIDSGPGENNNYSEHNNNTVVHGSWGHVSSVSEHRAQSSVIRKHKNELREEEEQGEEEGREGEFGISGLKLIQVPKRTTRFKPGSMDTYKKVPLYFSVSFLPLVLEIWVFWVFNLS